MIQNDCMTTYVDLICDRCFLCTHNSASLGLFPSAPARVHSNIDIDIDIQCDVLRTCGNGLDTLQLGTQN